MTLGEYAHNVIEIQLRRITKQEKRVLEDKEPEHLHQMRVGTRRLRTALQVFDRVIQLPKEAESKHLRSLAQVLGQVRDLDVQMADIRDSYQPQLDPAEQKQLDKVLSSLQKQRRKAFKKMSDFLSDNTYQQLKTAYSAWLEHPCYTSIAQLNIQTVLPDLLSPLLAELLMHPGWHVPVNSAHGDNSTTLHDLRKACKHARYQAEFFKPFYGEVFHQWIDTVKDLQDQLGKFQDTQVLLDLLDEALDKSDRLETLQSLIAQQQQESLTHWENIRHRYLNPDFRHHLHQMLLQPIEGNS